MNIRLKNYLWNYFTENGSVGAYLAYKRCERPDVTECGALKSRAKKRIENDI